MLEGLQALGQEMLGYGITSFSDAGILAEDLPLFALAKDSGALPQTVRGCLRWGRGDDGLSQRAQYQRPGLILDCMKIQLDGVPTSAKTAVMLEPYERYGDEAETRGLISYPREQIIANVVAWDGLGLTVKMHAAGDGAVRVAVDAVEAAREANGSSGLMHDVSHISFADPNDFARMRDLGGALEFSPYLFNPQPIVNDIRYAVGEERMQGWIPMRHGFDSGALVIIGSDWPVVDDFNPWPAIESMITRQNAGGVDEPINPGQRVILAEVIQAYTANAAKQNRRDLHAGTIAVGKRADLAVLNQPIFDVPGTVLHRTRAALVILDGKLVYSAE